MEILQPFVLHFGNKTLFDWLGFSPLFGKDSDDEVATEQQTAVVDMWVDVKFMSHDDPEIS